MEKKSKTFVTRGCTPDENSGGDCTAAMVLNNETKVVTIGDASQLTQVVTEYSCCNTDYCNSSHRFSQFSQLAIILTSSFLIHFTYL